MWHIILNPDKIDILSTPLGIRLGWHPREGFDEWYLKDCKCSNCKESGKFEKTYRPLPECELLFVCECGFWQCFQATEDHVFKDPLGSGVAGNR